MCAGRSSILHYGPLIETNYLLVYAPTPNGQSPSASLNKSNNPIWGFSEGIWLSGKTFDCRPRDCEFDPPSLQLKLLKRRYVLVLPKKNAPVYQGFTLSTLNNLVCHVWWALQYLALWATHRN